MKLLMNKYELKLSEPVGWLSEESTESIDEVEWIGDDGTCKELRICLFINGLLLNERRISRCVGSREEKDSDECYFFMF
jgi:hypothetical protein